MKPRILLVENQLIDASLMQMHLVLFGYDCVYIAKSCRDAYVWLLSNDVDLVISNLFQNNNKNNVYYLKRIKNKLIPIIVISDDINKTKLKKLLKFGPDLLLLKPINYVELELNLNLFFSKHSKK